MPTSISTLGLESWGNAFFDIWMTGSGYNSKPTDTVFILVGIGILSKCMLKLLIYRGHNSIDSIVGIGILPKCMLQLLIYIEDRVVPIQK
jgi:hypothetical protein